MRREYTTIRRGVTTDGYAQFGYELEVDDALLVARLTRKARVSATGRSAIGWGGVRLTLVDKVTGARLPKGFQNINGGKP